jgi:hypothetical protein
VTSGYLGLCAFRAAFSKWVCIKVEAA